MMQGGAFTYVSSPADISLNERITAEGKGPLFQDDECLRLYRRDLLCEHDLPPTACRSCSPRRLFLPVPLHVDTLAAALAADGPASKRRHFGFGRIRIDVDQGLCRQASFKRRGLSPRRINSQ